MKEAANPKICPHCDSPLDEEALTCPVCGKLFWQPDSLPTAEIIEGETKENTLGCLPLFFWPLLISFAVTMILILLGFIIHVFSHFKANQIKVIWLLCSAAAGGLVYLITVKIRKKSSQTHQK